MVVSASHGGGAGSCGRVRTLANKGKSSWCDWSLRKEVRLEEDAGLDLEERCRPRRTLGRTGTRERSVL